MITLKEKLKWWEEFRIIAALEGVENIDELTNEFQSRFPLSSSLPEIELLYHREPGSIIRSLLSE